MGDGGFTGLRRLHRNSFTPRKGSKKHKLSSFDKRYNKILSRARIKVENVFGALKHFGILSHRYRNRRRRFGLRFTIIAAARNLELGSKANY